MSSFLITASVLCAAAAAAAAIYERRRAERTMDVIERMLDEAAKGEFAEDGFDESRLSALEAKFSDYLSASAISARNVKKEKERIETLISDISHQTKTPIANLLLYSELLEEEALPQTARESVEAVHAQAEKLRFLIDALVKLSRLENGIIELKPRRQELSRLIESVCAQYAAKAREKGLELRTQETALEANCDEKWTTEAIGNIVDNAIKYTRTGGVEIAAVQYELFVRIDISDTGDGIAEEEQAKIFSRFYRAGNTEGGDGVGLGLYLARQIVSGEGGYIKVSSQKGKGSTFSVFLPR